MNRAVALAERGREPCDLPEHAPARVALRLERGDPLHHLEALVGAPDPLEEGREAARGGEVGVVVPGDVEDAEEQIDRARVVPERVGVNRTGLHQEIDPERVVGTVLRRRDEHLGEPVAPPHPRRELRELLPVRDHVRLEQDERHRVLERLPLASERRVQLGDLPVAANPLANAPDRLELDLEHANEIRVAPRFGVPLFEERRRALAHERALRRRRGGHRRAARAIARPLGRRHDRLAHLGGRRGDGEDPLEEARHVDRGVSPLRDQLLDDRER